MCHSPRPRDRKEALRGGGASGARQHEVSGDVSDEKFGGSGPRKPRPTFGDVMLGIPAGRGGEREERPRKGRGRGEGTVRAPRPVSVPASAGTPVEQTAVPPATPATPTAKPHRPERRRPQGPLVVVRRATGVVETRELKERPETPVSTASGSTSSPTLGPEATPEPAAEQGPAAEAPA